MPSVLFGRVCATACRTMSGGNDTCLSDRRLPGSLVGVETAVVRSDCLMLGQYAFFSQPEGSTVSVRPREAMYLLTGFLNGNKSAKETC